MYFAEVILDDYIPDREVFFAKVVRDSSTSNLSYIDKKKNTDVITSTMLFSSSLQMYVVLLYKKQLRIYTLTTLPGIICIPSHIGK